MLNTLKTKLMTAAVAAIVCTAPAFAEETFTIKDIRVHPLYDDVCKRPTGLDISYVENGEIKYRYIDNTPRPMDLEKSDNAQMYSWKNQGV